ncbi:MAG: DUF4358 domain-containing protein [Lachnospiraceae bacterium]|nr:DUF4358 domain-containing protein [Lachnospiraceae bacterium]
MKMRKVSGWIAAAAVCLLAACGSEKPQTEGAKATATPTQQVQQPADDAAPTEADAVEEEAATAQEIYDEICAEYSLPEMYPQDDNDILNAYGLDAAKIESYVCMEAAETRADRVFIVMLKDAADVADVETKFNNVLGQLSSQDSLDYYPDQADVITSASVKTKGNTVYLFISEYADGMEEILLDALN